MFWCEIPHFLFFNNRHAFRFDVAEKEFSLFKVSFRFVFHTEETKRKGRKKTQIGGTGRSAISVGEGKTQDFDPSENSSLAMSHKPAVPVLPRWHGHGCSPYHPSGRSFADIWSAASEVNRSLAINFRGFQIMFCTHAN